MFLGFSILVLHNMLKYMQICVREKMRKEKRKTTSAFLH